MEGQIISIDFGSVGAPLKSREEGLNTTTTSHKSFPLSKVLLYFKNSFNLYDSEKAKTDTFKEKVQENKAMTNLQINALQQSLQNGVKNLKQTTTVQSKSTETSTVLHCGEFIMKLAKDEE